MILTTCRCLRQAGFCLPLPLIVLGLHHGFQGLKERKTVWMSNIGNRKKLQFLHMLTYIPKLWWEHSLGSVLPEALVVHNVLDYHINQGLIISFFSPEKSYIFLIPLRWPFNLIFVCYLINAYFNNDSPEVSPHLLQHWWGVSNNTGTSPFERKERCGNETRPGNTLLCIMNCIYRKCIERHLQWLLCTYLIWKKTKMLPKTGNSSLLLAPC